MAISVIMQIAVNFMSGLYKQAIDLVKEGNFDRLDELHHYSSGIKAIGTDYAYYGIDALR